MERQILFVSGVARSGTTILGEWLDMHPQICLGIERFKFQFLRELNFDPALFEKGRFFKFEESDTNLRPDTNPKWLNLYSGLWRKWDNARVVGDKVPDLTGHLAKMAKLIENSKFIYIVRDLEPVAASWQARAERESDTAWPIQKDYRAAAESWSRQCTALRKAIEAKVFGEDRLVVIDYDTFFFEKRPDAASRIETFLGLDADQTFHNRIQKIIEDNANRRSDPMKRLPAEAGPFLKDVDRTDFKFLVDQSQKWWAA